MDKDRTESREKLKTDKGTLSTVELRQSLNDYLKGWNREYTFIEDKITYNFNERVLSLWQRFSGLDLVNRV